MAHLESLVVLDAAGKSGAALTFGFERAGYRVYATRLPDDALAMAQTRVPQLMVVAVDDAESLSFIGRLREDAPTRELPVVALGEPHRRDQALRAGADEFVARPAFIRDILTLSRLAVAVRQDGDDGGVVGLLEDYGLYFLVRALAVAGRSCVMELERHRRIGEVHVAKGVVVAARVGRMSGIAAFHHLLLWGEASLSLRFESPSADRRIAATVDELLESGRRFSEEFETISERVGGPQAVYAHEPRRAAEARGAIPAEVMTLVKHYDGRKPLIDIVEDSPFKPFDTIKITFRLSQLGAIARRDSRESTPLSERLAVRDWLVGGDEPRERPAGTPSGLTEAGRRAAEAYAAEAAARAAETSPADDILDDSATVRAAAAAAKPSVKPAAAPPVKPAAQPKAKQPARPAVEDQPVAAPKSVAAKAVSKAKKKRERRAGDPIAPAKLSPLATAAATSKEQHAFDDVEEEFFARESELWHAAPDTFDDLDPKPKLKQPGKKTPAGRDWFGLNKKK
ncbi:MAG: response regulator receiver protein [Myxococcales bacterium]|nr:response regulator receiver protein [Myxococcales bacterium]